MPPPNGNPYCHEAKETQTRKTEKSNSNRNRYIEQSQTSKKRQEQHCRDNEFPTLQPFGNLLNQFTAGLDV